MSRRAQLPDGTILEFPDETPDAVMDKAVKSHIAGTKPQKSMAERYAAAGINPTDGSPTEGNNFLQNAALAYGRSGVDTARGVGQLFGGSSAQDVDEARRLDAPLMATAGGKFGNVFGQVHQMLAMPEVRGAQLLGKAAPYVNAALHGGLFSGAQGVGEGESRGVNTAVGAGLGLGGQALSKVAGAAATKAKVIGNDVVQESIDLAKRAGIPLHLSQVTNSKALKTVSSALNYLPFSGAGKAGKAQQEAFNGAVARSFGADAPVLSDQVMKSARQRLNSEFDSIFHNAKIPAAPAVIRKMVAIERQAMDDLVDTDAGLVSKQFQKIVDKLQNGHLTGDQYQALRTSLGEAANGTKAGKFIKQLRSELDDMAKSALGPQDAARLTKAHGQWANMRTTEKALQQVEGAKGNVKPSSLWNLVRNGSTQEFRKLAQIGQNVLKDPIPDSGTASRELVYRGLGLGGGAAGAASALGMLIPAAKMAATGVTAARFLNSRAAAKLLGEGRPAGALARLLQPAPRALPLLTPAVSAAHERKKKP